jgi:hypothetical protein
MDRIDSTDPRTLITLSETQMTAKEIILPVPVPAPSIKYAMESVSNTVLAEKEIKRAK